MAGRRRNDRKRKLGAHIRSLREARKISQAALAAAAGNDLSQTDISKIESGKRWPSVPQLAGIFEALGVEDSVLAQFTQDAT
jgi:transcriptional regulator with XRE-family HTH domain